jgi:UDP-N-acetylglucosamine transferase subunit ALG13
MIFVTVGHQMPFDRLVRLVDQWASVHPEASIYAQIGETDYRPEHIDFSQLMSRDEFDAKLRGSDSVIAHAGTGTIIQTLLQQKPMLVLPRLSRFAETRNDHQVATARHFAAQGLVDAAFDDHSFLTRLDQFREFRPAHRVNAHASDELLTRLRSFVDSTAAG